MSYLTMLREPSNNIGLCVSRDSLWVMVKTVCEYYAKESESICQNSKHSLMSYLTMLGEPRNNKGLSSGRISLGVMGQDSHIIICIY